MRKALVGVLVLTSLCACKDTTCADAVFKEYVAVADDSRARLDKTKATPEQSEQMQQIAKELGTCKLRLQDEGPQMSEIHIEIKCDGDGFPSSAELAKRHAVEDALAEAEVGEVVDAGGGRGVMDIYVDVKDVAVAMAKTKAIVKRLGLESRTRIEPVPKPD